MRIAPLLLVAALVPLAAAAPAPTAPSANAAPPKAIACPYTPAEVAAALGVSVKAGQPGEMPFPGGVEYSCAYEQERGYMTLWVSQNVMSVADQKKGDAYYQQTLAGKATKIPGDPDGASWQLDAYNAKTVALHYLRGTHRVALRITSSVVPIPAMQPKLLRLRRLP